MTIVIVPHPESVFFYVSRSGRTTRHAITGPTHSMPLNITLFKIITGTLFALMLVALAILTLAPADEVPETNYTFTSDLRIILFVAALLILAFLFIRFNVNDLLAHEKKLEAANLARREAEERLQKLLDEEKDLNRLKSDFIRMASHEFRSPLTVMLSSAFLVTQYAERGEIDKVKDHAEKIRRSVAHLNTIIHDCLSVSDIEEDNLEVKAGEVDLAKFTEGICEDFAMLTRPGQKILYRHAGAQTVCTDAYMMRSIMSKLLANAVKYSPEDSVIEVSTAVDDDIHLVVRDSGIGIPAAELPHLFDRFYRASNAEHVPGTGLGLYIIRHYVDMLGGAIWVTSQEGMGTEFHVQVPDALSSDQ